MAFLVRKLKHRENMELIKNAATADAVIADVIEEFSISEGTLSTWFISSMDTEELNKAILAISISFKTLADSDFIIIDQSHLAKHELSIHQDPSTHDLCDELEYRHYNIVNIDIGKIKDCVGLIKDVVDSDDLNNPIYIVRYCSEDILELIADAYIKGIVKKDDIEEQLFNTLKKKRKEVFFSSN